VTSAGATAELLAGRGCRSVFVIGEEGIRDGARGRGHRAQRRRAERVDAVVVGWDRGADYAKLRTACVLVERGAAFVGTNGDASWPAPDGSLWPGAGALLAAVVHHHGARAGDRRQANAPLFHAALARAGGGRPLVIGDRLDTDVAGAAGPGVGFAARAHRHHQAEDLAARGRAADARGRRSVDPLAMSAPEAVAEAPAASPG
jgi:ribonucleotide monophosphatase NagD (HAD superfamily)